MTQRYTKTYDPAGGDDSMEPDPDGDWVLFRDVAAPEQARDTGGRERVPTKNGEWVMVPARRPTTELGPTYPCIWCGASLDLCGGSADPETRCCDLDDHPYATIRETLDALHAAAAPEAAPEEGCHGKSDARHLCAVHEGGWLDGTVSNRRCTIARAATPTPTTEEPNSIAGTPEDYR